MTDYLIRLEAARHAILIDTTAAIGQAAFTNVLSAAESIDVTATIDQQVFSLADITCETLTQRSMHVDQRHRIDLMEWLCSRHCPVLSNGRIAHQVHL